MTDVVDLQANRMSDHKKKNRPAVLAAVVSVVVSCLSVCLQLQLKNSLITQQ